LSAKRSAKGLPETIPLGEADTVEARKKWAELTGRRPAAGAPGTVEECCKLGSRPALTAKRRQSQ
jgi:hypothetical protein